jgi:hypothetical protein
MSNFEIAKQYGIAMANHTNKGGCIALGLLGSGLDADEVNLLFEEIEKNAQVKFINSEVDVVLMMEKL